jgi:hypothetical protein
MTKPLLSDHHLRHFSDPDKATSYFFKLRSMILSANWLLVGTALSEQNFSLLSFNIDVDDASGNPFLSGIHALNEDGEDNDLEDTNLDLLTAGIVKKDSRISVGAMPLDWPLNTRLAMNAQDHLDLHYPNWNKAGNGAGTFIVDLDGQTSLAKSKPKVKI